MLFKRIPIYLRGLTLRFNLYFLLFAYVPLLVFSVLGYMINREFIRQMELKRLHRSLQYGLQSFKKANEQDMAIIDRLLGADSSSVSNNLEGTFSIERRIVALETSSGWTFLNVGDRSLDLPLQKGHWLIYRLSDSSFYMSAKTPSGKRVITRFLLHVLLNIVQNLEYSVHSYLASRRLGMILSHREVHLLAASPHAEKRFQQLLNSIFHDSRYLSVSGLLDTDWQYIIQKPTKEIFRPLNRFLIQIVFANLALGFFLFVVSILVARSITRPIHTLVAAAKSIRDGELNQSVPVEGRDEIRLLANEFESMRQKLLESYQHMEQKIAQRTEALRQAQFQISHQEKMASLGILAAGIAHEIGNPLTSISSMTQILRRKVKDPDLDTYLSTILTNIERISKIVRELVDFARPSALEASWVNVNEVVRNAMGIVKYDRRAKYVQFHLELAENLPNLYLVSDQLLQVVLNILINALDAMKEGKGNIRISTRFLEEEVVISIQDDGIGIPEEHLNKIFEPFFTTKEVGKGTGLGLSVSYGIVKNFGGRIEVESEVGKGSTFTIFIPLTENRENSDES